MSLLLLYGPKTVTGAADLSGTGSQTIVGRRTQRTWLTANFEKGTNGATIAAADAGDATAWSLINNTSTGGSAIIYDTTHVAVGRQAAKFLQGSSAGNLQARWTSLSGSVTEHYGRFYLYAAANPVGAGVILITAKQVTGNLPTWSLSLDTSGKIVILDKDNAAVNQTTNAIAVNQWVRVEYHVVHSATVGQCEVKLFNTATSTTPTETLTTAANKNFLGFQDTVWFGQTGGPASYGIWLDGIMANSSGSYPGPADVANLSGTGTLTAAGAVVRNAAATLSGVGSLAATGVRTRLAAAAISGSGTLTAAPTHTAFAAASLPGNGTLASNGTRTRFGIAALTGTGAQTVAGFRTARGAAALTGTGSLAAAGVRRANGTVALTGTGGLTASGFIPGTNAANLTGTGSLTATGTHTAVASAALPGNGTLTTNGVRVRFGIAALTATSGITAIAFHQAFAAALLSGLGSLTAEGHGDEVTLPPTEGTGRLARMTVGHQDYGRSGRYGTTSRGRISRPLAGTKH